MFSTGGMWPLSPDSYRNVAGARPARSDILRWVPPEIVLSATRQAVNAVLGVTNGQLTAAYLHGSAVLGGWTPRSDVDLLLVADDELDALDPVAAVLAESAFPGNGLECSVVSQAQAAAAADPPWPFLLHVVTGESGGPRIGPGASHPGDRDLLMHYVVCRAAGYAVHGPPATELIGEVPRAAILSYLADELDWGLAHGTEAYVVLNACRALVYRSDQAIVSKVAGGQEALRRGLGPAALIARALDQQLGRRDTGPRDTGPPSPEARQFALATAGLLRDTVRTGEADRTGEAR